MRFPFFILCVMGWACGGEPVLAPPQPIPPVKKTVVSPTVVSVAPATVGAVGQWSGNHPLVQKIITPDTGPMEALLAREYSKAVQKGRKPYVMVFSDACDPCVALRESLKTPTMMEAFKGIHLILMDNAVWAPHLEALGMKSGSFPRIHELSDNGQASLRVITGEAWGEDVPMNMAPPLQTFLRQ